MNRLAILLLSLMAFQVLAEEQLPQGPEVVISPGDDERIKEYRVNGQLYMIEVVPTKGAPYFLVDSDGDGLLETRSNTIGSGMMIPSWTVRRW